MSVSRGTVALAVSAAVAAALFAPTLGYGFVWDDRALVVNNPWLADWAGVGQAFTHHFWGFLATGGPGGTYYRPLLHLVFFLVRATAGASPWAFHLLGLSAHVASTALVGVLARRLLQRSGQADGYAPAAAALLFAVHPLHVEAVAWVSGLGDVGATLGVLATLAALGAPATLGWGRAGAAALLALAAALTKETGALAFPLALAWLVTLRFDRRALLRAGLTLGIAAALYLTLRGLAVSGAVVTRRHPEVEGLALLFTGLALAWQQLAALVAPVELSSWHPLVPATSLLDGRVLGALAALGASAVLAGRTLRRGDATLAFPLALTVLAVLPGTLVTRLGENAFAERYAYLPSVGLALLAGGLLGHVLAPPMRPAAGLGVLLVGGALALITALQLPTWQDQEHFFLEMERTAPDAPPLGHDLGVVFLEKGDPRRALAAFERSHVRTADYWASRAVAHAQLGQVDEARDCLQRSLALVPDNAPALANLCRLERQVGKLDEARAHCARAASLAPAVVTVRLMNAQLLLKLGARDDARREFGAVLALDPANAAAKQALDGLGPNGSP